MTRRAIIVAIQRLISWEKYREELEWVKNESKHSGRMHIIRFV